MKKINLLLALFFGMITFYAQESENNDITICWDTSLSMLERNLEKEFEVLNKVFERTPNLNVQLLLFNVEVENKNFEIVNGNWSELKNTLASAVADGATIYSQLEGKIKNEKVFFFTDGNFLIEGENLPVKKGNFLINSVTLRNEDFLKRTALIGKGRLMDFAAILPNNLSKEKKNNSTETIKEISGTIYMDNVTASEVEIRVKGSQQVYTVDYQGKFKLAAKPGDSILISSRISKSMKIIPVGYFSKNVDVFMESNITALDEVVLSEKRIEAKDKEIVRTGNGLKAKEAVGYAVQSIGDNDITEVNTNLSTAVVGKFSGVNLANGEDLTRFSTRVNTSLLGNNYGLVIVDGTPIEQSNSSVTGGAFASISFIDPENIADITVLKGFAATNRYGTLGNNGVLLVTTKNGDYGDGESKPKNTALLQNNIYDDKTQIRVQDSPVIKTLKNEASIKDAYNKYLSLRNFNMNSDSFYLDSFMFFKDKDSKIALKIISNLWEKNPEKESYLKLVELSVRSLGEVDISKKINISLNTLNPTTLQPFFTEAQLHLEQENYQKALDSWLNLANGGSYGTMEVNEIKKSLEREIKNLVFLKRSNLNLSKLPESYSSNSQINVRLRLEWSNPKAEFKVQFVNPQKRYFNWEHTMASNRERIINETNLGFAMEEFEIYDDLKGTWQINIDYSGNIDTENKEPLVLLCSIYTDFGFVSQTREMVWLYVNSQANRKPLTTIKI
jgi:TonB-dependent SusC/RagA subfamily outer membrane receptor